MKKLTDDFFSAYKTAFPFTTVYTNKTPKEIIAQYNRIEDEFNITFPKSFIEWHKTYFLLDGDISIVRLPHSSPLEPLKEIRKNLDWYIPKQIIPQGLYPFASDGNDAGPWVFDGRVSVK